MRTLFHFVLLLLPFHLMCASVEKVEGSVNFSVPKTGEVIECGFRTETDRVSSVSRLEIWRLSAPSVKEYRFESEPGAVFLESVKIQQLGETSGDLLLVFWERGASLTGLSVLGIKPDGHIGLLFDDDCRMGYQIVDVFGSGWPQIVAVDGRPASQHFVTRVFQYRLKGAIELVAKAETTVPQRYALLSNSTTPILRLSPEESEPKPTNQLKHVNGQSTK